MIKLSLDVKINGKQGKMALKVFTINTLLA